MIEEKIKKLQENEELRKELVKNIETILFNSKFGNKVIKAKDIAKQFKIADNVFSEIRNNKRKLSTKTVIKYLKILKTKYDLWNK